MRGLGLGVLGMGMGTPHGYFPASLGALVLALDARQIVPSGGLVGSWPDLSAAPFTVSAAGAQRPAYVADAGDGSPAVDFNGTTTFLDGTGVPFGQAAANYTVAALVKSDTDGPPIVCSGTGFRMCGISRDLPTAAVHRIFDNASGDKELTLGSLSGAVWHLLIARRTGNTMKLRNAGGSDVTDTAAGGALTLTQFGVGTWPGVSFFDGKIAGIWAWSEHLSDANCSAFRTWLQGQRAICP